MKPKEQRQLEAAYRLTARKVLDVTRNLEDLRQERDLEGKFPSWRTDELERREKDLAEARALRYQQAQTLVTKGYWNTNPHQPLSTT